MRFLLLMLVFIFAAVSLRAQTAPTLTAIGNGEKVRIAFKGKSKIVKLEADFAGDFTAGGDAPHRYTTLLSVEKGDSLYLVAKFTSGAAISDKNAPCGGDRPTTLLLIKAAKNLKIEKVQTEIYDSCAFNGAGRYVQGKPRLTKDKLSILFDEGSKKYALTFDANDAGSGLQLKAR